jgi:hypothetical protein
MDSTIFWVVILFSTLMIVLWFGYKAWRRSKSRVSRLARNRSSANEWKDRHSQPENPADAITQLGHSLKEKSANARTVSRYSQKPYLAEDQTEIRQVQKGNIPDEQHHHKENSADAPTQIGGNRINHVEPEDDRTIL